MDGTLILIIIYVIFVIIFIITITGNFTHPTKYPCIGCQDGYLTQHLGEYSCHAFDCDYANDILSFYYILYSAKQAVDLYPPPYRRVEVHHLPWTFTYSMYRLR